MSKLPFKDLREPGGVQSAEDISKDWLLSNPLLYRSKRMASFDKKMDIDQNDAESQAENDFGSVSTYLDPLLKLFKRDRIESAFSYNMSDILRSPMSRNSKTSKHFDYEVNNLMNLFELGVLYLNDGLYAATEEFFMENDDNNDHLLPVSIRIEDLRLYVPINKLVEVLNNSSMTIMKGHIKLVSIKTQPSRRIYGISCMLRINSTFIVQCLIGVTDDPTFTYKIHQDYSFKCPTVKLNHRIRIGSC